MAMITERAYHHPADFDALCDLIGFCRPREWRNDYPSAVDLREMLALPDVQEQTRLWVTFLEDVLVAYALVDPYQNLCFDVLPDLYDQGVLPFIIAYGVQVAEDRGLETLDAVCRPADTRRIQALEREGFVAQAVRTLSMARPLTDAVPEPTVLDGYSLRPLAGAGEVGALVEVHRAAFGTDHMTADLRHAMMSTPDYDPALDWVVLDPAGRLAAYCTCTLSDDDRDPPLPVGSIDTVATHPDYQGQGLARALMLQAMRLLMERGVGQVTLGTSSENGAMQGLARALGFTVTDERVWFSRAVG